jgi:hypothetical protein
VVRGRDMRARFTQMPDESSQRRAVGKKQRKVIQPESPAARRRFDSRSRLQMKERRVGIVRAQRSGRSFARHHAKANDVLVVLERLLEVAHEEADRTRMCFAWKPIARRRDAVLHRTANLTIVSRQSQVVGYEPAVTKEDRTAGRVTVDA